MRPHLLALVAVAAACAGCGGKVEPVVDELAFVPRSGSAGYGFVGGMHVTLIDPVTDGVRSS
ncbi:MAG TPA: hypothetical protein VIF15_17165 [Polyangiaceae bacterium]|jgi:hypothetical protein